MWKLSDHIPSHFQTYGIQMQCGNILHKTKNRDICKDLLTCTPHSRLGRMALHLHQPGPDNHLDRIKSWNLEFHFFFIKFHWRISVPAQKRITFEWQWKVVMPFLEAIHFLRLSVLNKYLQERNYSSIFIYLFFLKNEVQSFTLAILFHCLPFFPFHIMSQKKMRLEPGDEFLCVLPSDDMKERWGN